LTDLLALGFSGGGDSTALLHALRQCAPDRPVLALIVDHGLRAESRQEAEQAADYAEQLGARVEILRWETPRPGQGAARQARHHLLAQACARHGVGVLCLAHTLDDRVETLRMRAHRQGSWRTLTGMRALDISPAWPDGEGLMLARPFLGLRRRILRHYLDHVGARWIEDPSNQDLRFERVRWRQAAPREDSRAEQALLAMSDHSLMAEALLRQSAWRLIARGADWRRWGGVILDRDVFARADDPIVLRALEALVLAVSGRQIGPGLPQTRRFLTALKHHNAISACGVVLTEQGVLGRDPGAVLGRKDGSAQPLKQPLSTGQTAVFDGRWRVQADRALTVQALGDAAGQGEIDLHSVPAVFRPGLVGAVDSDSGEIFAIFGFQSAEQGLAHLLYANRMRRWLLPPKPASWFDIEQPAAHLRAALAKSV